MDALRWAGLALAGGYVALVTLFVAGDAVVDPGGWVGVGGTAAWVATTAGLGLVAWWRPFGALVTLGVLASAAVALGLWFLVDYGAARSWEDGHGPVSLVLVVTVCGPAAVAGLSRPRAAGRLILAVTVAPVLLAAVGAGSHFYEPLSVGLLLLPLVASGVVFVLAGREPGDRGPG